MAVSALEAELELGLKCKQALLHSSSVNEDSKFNHFKTASTAPFFSFHKKPRLCPRTMGGKKQDKWTQDSNAYNYV